MSLLDNYYSLLTQKGYLTDKNQIQALSLLEKIRFEIENKEPKKFRWFKKFGLKSTSPKTKGLYIWGSVGRGKTFIMDLFFNNLNIEEKKRYHFNHFMKYVHSEIFKLRQKKEKDNLLYKVAENFALNTKVLCFDEFFIEDIADAMILGDFFKYLFNLGVTIIATSNVKISLLYLGGIQRESFMKAIYSLQENCMEFNLDNEVDYRWRNLSKQSNYFYPLNKESNNNLEKFFKENVLKDNEVLENHTIYLEGRKTKVVKQSQKIIWFDFNIICGDGKSSADYITIAENFDKVIISNIPILTLENESRRFISLVDEFYDKKVILIMSMEDYIKKIYQGSLLKFQYQRTISRLNEMQNFEYIEEARKLRQND